MLKTHNSISLGKFSSNPRETVFLFCVCSYEKQNKNCGKQKEKVGHFHFSMHFMKW